MMPQTDPATHPSHVESLKHSADNTGAPAAQNTPSCTAPFGSLPAACRWACICPGSLSRAW